MPNKQVLKRATTALTVVDVKKAKTSLELTEMRFKMHLRPLREFTNSQDSMHDKVEELNRDIRRASSDSQFSQASILSLEARLICLISDIKESKSVTSKEEDLVNMTVNDIRGVVKLL